MKFLADENVEWPIVFQMRHRGYDVSAVREVMPGAEDDDILREAVKEGRILITNDNDFGFMVFHQKMDAVGVILMRFTEESFDKKLGVLEYLLKHHAGKLAGHFTVISENQIKIRPLKK